MMLSLTSAGNPDHGQDPTETLFGCEPGKLIKVETFKEASARNGVVSYILHCHKSVAVLPTKTAGKSLKQTTLDRG